jgi:hypothetical protein
MMWQSQKALDLLRDPRCLVHNSVPDRMGGEGEFKLRGVAADVTDPAERERYGVAMATKLDMPSLTGDYHLYLIDIVDVAVVTRDESEQYVELWRAAD